MRRTRRSAANENGPGSSGLDLGQTRDVPVGFLQGQEQPGVLARFAPAGEHESRAATQAAPHVGERLRRISEEHHAETRAEQIGSAGLEWIHCCVGEDEVDRQPFRRKLAGSLQHRRGHVDAEHTAARRHAAGQCDRRGATSATYVQYDFANGRGGSIEQDLGHRCEQGILRLLPIQPALATGAVPVRDLVSVAVIGGRQIAGRHGRYLF
jgi:hypothetical protein